MFMVMLAMFMLVSVRHRRMRMLVRVWHVAARMLMLVMRIVVHVLMRMRDLFVCMGMCVLVLCHVKTPFNDTEN